MTTLKDIAEKAGVSIATVSFALNNSNKIKQETIKKVLKIAEEMDYIPNARAQALVKRTTKTIALVIPGIINPIFEELLEGLGKIISEEDYNIILCSTNYYRAEKEKKYINLFKSRIVDGAIFAFMDESMNNDDEEIIDLMNNYIPVVYVDRNVNKNKIIPVVRADLKEAAYQLTSYLIKIGHKNIGFVGRSSERIRGFKNALLENNLAVKQEYLFSHHSNTLKGGYVIGEKIANLKKLPTALVCLNDEMAFGIIQILTKKKINIPKDISVCGIDNIAMASFYNPPLTTVDVPMCKMGEKAGRLLFKLIKKESIPEKEKYNEFPTTLKIRESTAPPKY